MATIEQLQELDARVTNTIAEGMQVMKTDIGKEKNKIMNQITAQFE